MAKPVKTSEVVFLPKGSINAIISYLQDRNFNICKADKFIIATMGRPQSGWINIGTNKLSKFDFFYRLTTAKAAMVDITLIPGETTHVFLQNLAQKFGLNFDILLGIYLQNSPLAEGFLHPETYKIPLGISEVDLIYHLINASRQKHKELSNKIFGSYNEKKWFEYLIVASIIQKEAANSDEMPLVASVIYNRLKKRMKLQMDGTLNYGKFSHEKITAERIRDDTSEFNTYLNEGLPPLPVCVVSANSIIAAIFPAKTQYLYFVLDRKTMTHKFSNTYSEHAKNIKK